MSALEKLRSVARDGDPERVKRTIEAFQEEVVVRALSEDQQGDDRAKRMLLEAPGGGLSMDDEVHVLLKRKAFDRAACLAVACKGIAWGGHDRAIEELLGRLTA